MALSKGNGGKLNYTGRCSLGGAQLAVSGTIAYVDANHRYEAAMTSGIGGFRGVAVGQKQGDKIVFDLQQRANDDEGNDISIAANVILSAATTISVDFHATFNRQRRQGRRQRSRSPRPEASEHPECKGRPRAALFVCGIGGSGMTLPPKPLA